MLSEAPASTPNRLSRSGSSAARCLTVDSRRESANLLRRLSCCVRQSLRLPMREMQRSFHSPLRQPCRIAREPATTLQSALTLHSSGTRLSLRSFLTPHFHVSHQKVPQCPAASAQPVQTMRIRKFPRPEPIVVQALNQCQPFIGIFCRGSERHRLAFFVPLRAEHVAQPVGLIAQSTDLAHSHPRPDVRFMVDFKAAKFGNNVHPSTSCQTTRHAIGTTQKAVRPSQLPQHQISSISTTALPLQSHV